MRRIQQEKGRRAIRRAGITSAVLSMALAGSGIGLIEFQQSSRTNDASNAALVYDDPSDPDFTITISQSTDFPDPDPTDTGPGDDPTDDPTDTLDPIPTETTSDPGGGEGTTLEVSSDGNYGTVAPGLAACSATVSFTSPPDLANYSYQLNWRGTSSGGVAAWRLEFYHGSYPVDTTVGTDKWQRADGSGDTNPNKSYALQPADAGQDGKVNWRMCVRNLGSNNLQGTWHLDATSTHK